MTATEEKPKTGKPVVQGITIDGAKSKDLDDAFWVTKTDEGYVVDVSIANVSKEIKLFSHLDLCAAARKETLYRRDDNLPMLPRKLADDKCSLLPGKERPVMVTRLTLSHDCSILKTELFTARLKSAKQFSHLTSDLALFNEQDPYAEQIRLCQEVATAFYEKRREAGALAFYDVSSKLYADEEGAIRKYDGEFFHAQMIVQEMMIAANCAMATWAAEQDIPFIYRNHEATAACPGHASMVEQVSQALLNPMALPALAEKMRLWAKKARYGTKVLGHFGLNLPVYAHCTSPIRRYVDLVNQRMIRAQLKGKPLPYTAEDLESLAQEINTWVDARDEAFSEKMKTKMIELRQKQAEDTNRLKNQTPETFSKILKRAAKDGDPLPDFAVEVVRRVGRLTPFDLYTLTFETNDAWQEVRNLTIKPSLEKNPEFSVSILDIARSRNGISYVIDCQRQNDQFAAKAVVTTNLDPTKTMSPVCTDTTKKGAGQKSAVAWLIGYAGRQLDYDDGVAIKEILPPPPKPSAPASNKDHVSAVNLKCQQNKWPMPEYVFKKKGPDHTPTIECTVKLSCEKGFFQGMSEARDKKQAKQQAAKALLKNLP